MSALTITGLKTQRLATIYPNGLNKINAIDHADFEDNMIDSFLNLMDQYYLLGLRTYLPSRTYKPDECCIYNDIIYQNQGLGNLLNKTPGVDPAIPWVALTFQDNGLSEFSPYDNATTYNVDDTCRFGDKLYKCNNGPSQGNAPPNLAFWTEVSPALGGAIPQWQPGSFYKYNKLVRFENNMYRCVQVGGLFSGATFLTELATDLWRIFPEPVSILRADLVARMAAGEVAFNQWYFLTDQDIWLKGTSPSTVSIEGLMKTPINNAQSYPKYAGIWEPIPTSYTLGKIVFWLNKLYTNITGTNLLFDPRTDTTNWQLIPTSDASKYRYEIDVIEYDILVYGLQVWRDKRGNVLRRNESDVDWFDKFLRGSDYIRNNQTSFDSTLFNAHLRGGFSIITSLIIMNSIVELRNCFGGSSFTNSQFSNIKFLHDRSTTGSGIDRCVFNSNDLNGAVFLMDDSNATEITGARMIYDLPKTLIKKTFDITGLTTIDLVGVFADLIILTSTNGNETIDTISNANADTKYLFEASGVIVTFTSGAVNIKGKGNIDVVLQSGDNAEFIIRGSNAVELNRSNY